MTRRDSKANPEVSVLMSVRNEATWVDQAIESLLCQTWEDFELLVTDDGSDDSTQGILSGYASRDKRVRLLTHSTSIGLAASLNEQIREARGHYMARLDGDDVTRSDRLEKQIRFMEEHSQVGLLGSYCREVDSMGREVSIWRRPTTNKGLQKALFRGNPFIHSTVMLRREVFENVGLYDPHWSYAQDYDLWLRVAGKFEMANIPEPLVDLRVDWRKVVRKNREARQSEFRILFRHIRKEDYPFYYWAYLFRPLVLSIIPTALMLRLKLLQRRGRLSRNPD